MALSPLDVKRKIAEMHRINSAKSEMEFRIAEREDEILRLGEQIKSQDAAIEKLKAEFEAEGIAPPKGF